MLILLPVCWCVVALIDDFLVANSGSSIVCFQAYNNATCGQAVGPKQCSVEGRCTHTDISNGIDESTLQSCRNNGGYVEIELFRNTSTCRAEKRVYAFNTSTSGCQRVGQYYGQMSCGEYLERGAVNWSRAGLWSSHMIRLAGSFFLSFSSFTQLVSYMLQRAATAADAPPVQ